MALPPILANLPFLKNLKTEDLSQERSGDGQAAKTKETDETAFLPQDVVDISRVASRNLDGIKSLSEDEVPAVLADARSQLEDSGLPLGLEAGFSV